MAGIKSMKIITGRAANEDDFIEFIDVEISAYLLEFLSAHASLDHNVIRAPKVSFSINNSAIFCTIKNTPHKLLHIDRVVC